MPAFLGGDVLDCVAEPVLMIEGNRRDQAEIRIDHVDRVESPTQPDLQHPGVAAPRREHQQRGQRAELEERQRHATAHGFDRSERVGEFVVCGCDAVDTTRSL